MDATHGNLNAGDRRDLVRHVTTDRHGIVIARVRPGHHAEVLDVSAAGVLIDTRHRLLPGAVVDLHFETLEHRTALRGRVLRCAIASVGATGVWYRGAIRFDHLLQWFIDDPSQKQEVPGVLGVNFSEDRAAATHPRLHFSAPSRDNGRNL